MIEEGLIFRSIEVAEVLLPKVASSGSDLQHQMGSIVRHVAGSPRRHVEFALAMHAMPTPKNVVRSLCVADDERVVH